MLMFWILLLILLAVIGGITWAFFVAFVRRTDATSPFSEKHMTFLSRYRDVIEAGIRFIETQPHTRVYTTSFDGLRLAARYYPCGNSRRTILLFHGYRSTAQRDFSCAVEMYGKLGLNVLLIDQRSHGESAGRLITFGVKERRDVLSWIDFVHTHIDRDAALFLGGLSMGASTVLMSTALSLPYTVKGIIADCGFTSPADIIGRVARQDYHVPARVALPVLDLLCRLVGKFSIRETSTTAALTASTIPVCFIHGKADHFVPYEMSVTAYQAAAGEKHLYLVEGAEHGCSFLLDPEGITAAIRDFVATHSTASPTPIET